jgi:putative oxidoreductase
MTLRFGVAVLLTIHGWSRLLTGGIVPFGTWLESLGLPLGVVMAGVITAYEIIAPVLIILGRWVSYLAFGHACIIFMGIVLVHAPEGWFVVGAGRNGMEYSVLLLICLFCIAHHRWPRRRR